MKFLVPSTCLFAVLLLVGCAHDRPSPVVMVPTTPAPTMVTPKDSPGGKVVASNAAGRFVVLNYPTAQMPKVDQTLFLYRGGLKVAEIKITGPQSDDNTVADIITGQAQVGDEVRDQ